MTAATLEPRALPYAGRALLSRAALHPVLERNTHHDNRTDQPDAPQGSVHRQA